jgi:hypothetical protein
MTTNIKVIQGHPCLTKKVTIEVAMPIEEIIAAKIAAESDMKMNGMLISEASPEELLTLAEIINEHFNVP